MSQKSRPHKQWFFFFLMARILILFDVCVNLPYICGIDKIAMNYFQKKKCIDPLHVLGYISNCRTREHFCDVVIVDSESD